MQAVPPEAVKIAGRTSGLHQLPACLLRHHSVLVADFCQFIPLFLLRAPAIVADESMGEWIQDVATA